MTNAHVSESVESAGVISNPQPRQMRKGRGKTRGFSIQKKRKNNPNGKLEVIIPPDRTVAVGPGANNFVTELSVTVDQNAKHDVKTWKKVSDLAKERIVAHMLDAFEITDTQHTRETILHTANNLYRYRRSRLHDHFKKFATKEERLQNIPEDVTEVEWKFLVEYFDSDPFKRMSARNKINKEKQGINHICGRKSFGAVSFEERDAITGKEPNFQKLWEKTHMKNGHWVNDAAAELNDKVNELVAEQVQETEEGTDMDHIVNASFIKIVGEKSGYYRGQGSGLKLTNKRSMQGLQEQLQAHKKEVEEERHKRESVESKLKEVQEQLEEERKNLEVIKAHVGVMEVRVGREQKMLKEGMVGLASLIQGSKTRLPAALFNIITNLSGSDEASPASPTDDIMDDEA
uniref:Transposase, Ptta/En/Spm, plant n=1 Tax=Nicotiana tabacum TaxID=4097 RepID=A0A1S4A4B6_TOBAC|nr:PREDICTED: uncharacterized protein LOC107793552 [Nicotiana tabacum]